MATAEARLINGRVWACLTRPADLGGERRDKVTFAITSPSQQRIAWIFVQRQRLAA